MMNSQTEAVMHSLYKEMAKNLGPGRVLDLRETKSLATIDLDKGYVFAVLKADEVVFQPVIVPANSYFDSE